MTDTTAGGLYTAQKSNLFASDAALIRRRYRAERRFRAYGLAAILFAAVFLVVLLADIFLKAMPAFTQYRMKLDMPVSAEAVDPEKTGNPSTIAGGDFDQVVRNGLLSLFPTVTSRGDRRALEGLLSTAATDNVRREVVRNPSLIGKNVTAPVLLSSDADLYLRGTATRTRTLAGEGVATPSDTTGSVTVSAGANAFAVELRLIKTLMAERAKLLDNTARRFDLSAKSTEADLKAANDRLAAAKSAGNQQRVTELEAQVAKLTSDRDNLAQQATESRTKAGELRQKYEHATGAEELDNRLPSLLVAINGGVVKATNLSSNQISGDVLVPLANTDAAPAGKWRLIVLETPEDSRKIQDRSVAFLEVLKEKGAVESVPNLAFFTSGDSREAEVAGIIGALAGSAFTMLVTLVLCLPIGVLAAVYLEEFAPKNRLTDLVEVNINNLAAVPSIVFGLLGLAMFLGFFGLPRSSPLVGGLVLALLVLPTIIIASRAALKAVPPSIREAALGVGASKQQAVFHHVLPLAMPGVLTGTIIGMAHALGETAPLLMIGMVAFIVDVPHTITDAATVLPVQIFLWSDLPEIGFQAKTAAAILVLLAFLFVMNGMAIWLRKRFERRW
jgi:phosphate transport system permease protein